MRMANILGRIWWILIEVLISGVVAWYGPYLLSPFIKSYVNIDDLMLRLGSDALTLMGFTITALAIIARNIDKPIFDEVREKKSFADLWYVFGLTACTLGALAILISVSYIFVAPSWLIYVQNFLLVLNIFLVMNCIAFLVTVVSLVNRNRIEEVENQEPTNPDLS